MNTKKLLLAGAAVIAIAGAGIHHIAAIANAEEAVAILKTPKDIKGGGEALTPTVTTIGQFKTVYYSHSPSDTTGQTRTITSEEEMDITSVTVNCRMLVGAKTFTSNIFLDSGGGIILNITTAGEGTAHLVFPTPIPLRSGQVLYFAYPASPSGQTLAMELSFNGTDANTKSTAFVVK
ncbi:hypothetical protein BH09SUM1_BH09SUM1_02120 [soil metagenome]